MPDGIALRIDAVAGTSFGVRRETVRAGMIGASYKPVVSRVPPSGHVVIRTEA
jgi:hypothetical protein